MLSFLDSKHLVLLDINSNGLFFYLAKDVTNLPALDFASLVALEHVLEEKICQSNLLFDDVKVCKLIDKSLRSFDLKAYNLVFLLSPEFSVLEKQLLTKNFPFWQKKELVERHFFYNFYLMQKRNFSKYKFLINLFADCAELSLFNQEKLLAYKKIDLHNLALWSKAFLDKQMAMHGIEKPECFYFFTNNLSARVPVGDMAKYLKMEAIAIDRLC